MTSKEEVKKANDIQRISLKGHKSSVTCLAHSSSSIIPAKLNSKSNSQSKSESNTEDVFTSDVLLLSGSEDGTARLWDLRSGTRAIKCIMVPEKEDVTSVAFYPASIETSQVNDESTAKITCSRLSNAYTVYVSCGANVYGYDIRNSSAPLIREYDHNLTSQLQNQDDINQLSFVFAKHGNAPTCSSPCFIAAADDYGHVRLSDVHSSSLSSKILPHASMNNPAIVTNAIFQPKSRHIFHSKQSLILASGGTDCTVHLWDALSKRSLHSPSLSHVITQDDQNTTGQVCNPPFIHSLSFSHSGILLAAGLGDGTTLIYRIHDPSLSSSTSSTFTNISKKKGNAKSSKHLKKQHQTTSKKQSPKLQLDPCVRLRDGHGSSVACAHFPRFHLSNSSDTQTHTQAQMNHYIAKEDRLFCSAGNDGAILFWDLGINVVGKEALDPSSFFSSTSHSNSQHIRSCHNSERTLKDGKQSILFGIPHEQKPNWLTSSSQTQSGVLPSSLFVADTTNDITVYMMDII